MKPILRQGDSEPIKVVVRDEATKALFDLTSCQIEWKLALSQASAVGLLTKTLGNGGIEVTDAVHGVFEVKLGATETAALAPGEYYHQARITLPDGTTKKTVFRGYLTVEDTVP